MGLSFGDLNSGGKLDIFGSNMGDYMLSNISDMPYELGDQSSRWFLANARGSFDGPGVGD